MIPVRIQTVRAASLCPADISRLRALPAHPVHLAAMEALDRAAAAAARAPPRDPPRAPHMMLAREMAADELRGYLAYHRINSHTVMLDYLFSPYGGHGIGTLLMDRFEGAHGGLTAVLMTTASALGFYQRRGYTVNAAYMLSKELPKTLHPDCQTFFPGQV